MIKSNWIILFGIWLCCGKSFSQGAVESIDSLKKVASSQKQDTSSVRALIRLGSLIGRTDPNLGCKYDKKAFELAAKIRYDWGTAEACRGMSSNYTLMDSFALATTYALKSIELFESIKNKKGIAKAYNDLGVVYVAQNMLDDAIMCFEKSLAMRESEAEKSKPLNNIGIIYSRLKNYSKAEEYITKALLLEKKYGKIENEAKMLECLGSVAANTKRPKLAKLYFDRAIFIFDSIGDLINKGKCLTGITTHYLQLKEYELAGLAARQARQLIAGRSDPGQLEIIFGVMREVERAKGNSKLALFYSDSVIIIKQELYTNELSLQTKELLKKYQSEKIEKENAILKEEKLISEASEARRNAIYVSITASLAMAGLIFFLYMRQKKIRQEQRSTELEQKVLRAQMNPHFIFNALNAIQKLYLEKRLDQADEYMGDFGQLLRRILDNSGRSHISLHEEIATLRLYLNLEKNRLEGRMEYQIENIENLDTHHTLVPPLILQPIIENAIWHGIAPKGRGIIKVSFRQKPGQKLLIATIEDDGVGLAFDSDKKHESRGINLTRERLKPNGWVKIEGGKGQGTLVTMAIPYK